jgi:hypothetical protein
LYIHPTRPDPAHGIPASRYHAKLSAADRAAAHGAFLRDDVAVLAATIAYGMVRVLGAEGVLFVLLSQAIRRASK